MIRDIYFSIITVSYNSSKTIERTIKSVLNQSFKDYEYLIVDGNSNDDTVSIIKKYEPLFEGRMRWVSESDSGIYNAMNKGINMAKGEIVSIVNSDDWLENEALYNVHQWYSANAGTINNTILCGQLRFHYLTGDTQVLSTNKERFEKCTLHYTMGLIHPATFVPLQCYKRYGVFEEKLPIFADTEFVIRCSKMGCKFGFIDRILSNMSDGGVSSRFKKSRCEEQKFILSKYVSSKREYYRLYYRFLIKEICKSVLPLSVIKTYRSFFFKR